MSFRWWNGEEYTNLPKVRHLRWPAQIGVINANQCVCPNKYHGISPASSSLVFWRWIKVLYNQKYIFQWRKRRTNRVKIISDWLTTRRYTVDDADDKWELVWSVFVLFTSKRHLQVNGGGWRPKKEWFTCESLSHVPSSVDTPKLKINISTRYREERIEYSSRIAQ